MVCSISTYTYKSQPKKHYSTTNALCTRVLLRAGKSLFMAVWIVFQDCVFQQFAAKYCSWDSSLVKWPQNSWIRATPCYAWSFRAWTLSRASWKSSLNSQYFGSAFRKFTLRSTIWKMAHDLADTKSSRFLFVIVIWYTITPFDSSSLSSFTMAANLSHFIHKLTWLMSKASAKFSHAKY